MNHINRKANLKRWLSTLNSKELQKISHITFVLSRLYAIRDSYMFNNIPLQAFLEDNFLNKDELVTFLIALHNKGVIDISRYSELEVRTIDIDVNVLNDLNTTLEIYPDIFHYLTDQLNRMINPQDVFELGNKLVWLEAFKWKNDLEFSFENDKIVKFSKKDSTRIIIFTLLTDKKGEYLAVNTMASKTGKSGAEVRITIGHLNKEKLAKIGFRIAENKKGAYRIEQIPTIKHSPL